MNKKFKITMLLIIISIGTVLASGCNNSVASNQAQDEEKYTPVEIEEVTAGTIGNKIKINGKIVANEEIAIIPKAMGIVTKVNVELGDFVEKGSILFIIEQER